MHIKKNDMVEVIAGADRGVRARVVTVLPKRGKVVVEGVARVYKHLRRTQKNPQGGRLSKEMPISASNVMLVCPARGQPARSGVRLRADGGKDRFCKKCSRETGVISRPPSAKNGSLSRIIEQ